MQLNAKDILYEDEMLIAVNKPAGIPTQDTPKRKGSLWRSLKQYLGDDAYLGMHHRLDTLTSGVVLFTKHPSANAALAKAFQEQKIEKHYCALAFSNQPLKEAQWFCEKAIAQVTPSHRYQFTVDPKRGKPARTEFWLEDQQPFERLHACLLRVKPYTGRTHQIRVHLQDYGLSLLGDALYANHRIPARIRAVAPKALTLHAWSLTLKHPATDKMLEIKADVPKSWEPVLSICNLFFHS